MSDTVHVLNGRGDVCLTYTPPPLDWAPVGFSDGGVQYRRNVDPVSVTEADKASVPLFLDSGVDAWERSIDRTTRALQRQFGVPPTYLDHAYPAPHRQPQRKSRDRARTAVDVVRDVAMVFAPLFAFTGRCAVAVWACLVALVVGARDRYRAWVDAPRQAEGARRVELIRLREGAAEQAAFADENDMPESAAVWRQIAEQGRGDAA